MTPQLGLFDADPSLVCSHGVPSWDWSQSSPTGIGKGRWHCPGCRAYSEQAAAEFAAAVAAGTYDREGYTPAERRKQQRRQA